MDKKASEKAKELIEKMKMIDNAFDKKQKKHCATVCVNEIISDLRSYRMKPYLTVEQCVEASEFWQNVLIEIEKY